MEPLENRVALSTNPVSFVFTGAAQTWAVPAGVQSVGFLATGGFGGGMGAATVPANQLSGVLAIPSGATVPCTAPAFSGSSPLATGSNATQFTCPGLTQPVSPR